eukprot:TRINITY_DN13316_c0_g1_i2.p2 TRINITY_DN13316_c0_g1~~TRINITY_DN13316_c0_g1_i2.p2  ORF type:complete len:110 (-),score=49.91 TRINITY_DN13316_c0_g1_i2:133-462(-)
MSDSCVFGSGSLFFFFFFFSSRRRHTRCREVSWARRCVQETGINAEYMGNEKELLLKVKKKEDEINSLWDTLKDMYNRRSDSFDLRNVLDLLSLRSLDIKARQKLNITF